MYMFPFVVGKKKWTAKPLKRMTCGFIFLVAKFRCFVEHFAFYNSIIYNMNKLHNEGGIG